MTDKVKNIALLMSDLHIKEDNIQLIDSVFDEALTLCDNIGLRHIIIMGDVFTSRRSQSLDVLNAFGSMLGRANDKGVGVIAFPGNHDKVDEDSDDSYLDQYRYHPGFMLIREPYYHSGLGIHMMPYYKYSYPARLEELADGEVLLTHIGIDGAVLNDKSGKYAGGSIKPSMFDSFKKVYVGHFHNKCKIGSNIEYIGSTHQNNFGEDSDKGFSVLRSDGEIRHMKYSFTSYTTVTYDIYDFDTEELIPMLDEILIRCKLITGNVRLIIKGLRNQYPAIDLVKFDSAGIKVVFEEVDTVDKTSIEDSGFREFDDQSISDEFSNFCGDENLNDSEGFNYLNKALYGL